MTDCMLKHKRFYCREWTFSKLTHCLETRSSSKTCGVLVVGGAGCGKTALCCEAIWPTSAGKQAALSRRNLAHHFCQNHDPRTLSPAHFVASVARQLEQSEWLPEYRDEALARPAAQRCLAADACRDDPDSAFVEGVLRPLGALLRPPQNVFILVDSLDEAFADRLDVGEGGGCAAPDAEDDSATSSGNAPPVLTGASARPSRSIAELLGRSHHLFPPWLLLVCTVRKQRRSLTRWFAGFRKVTIDDLRKAHVVRDVQQYIMYRLDAEESLRRHLRKDTAELFNQLHIKSNGCFLFLEKILDGIAKNSLSLREVREIPGTLNGLYLWLCQRLFPQQTFSAVRPIFEVMLASRRPLTVEEIFLCVWTRDTSLDYDRFCQSVAGIAEQLFAATGSDGSARIFFHDSFAEWLEDVKHCTQKYHCRAKEGHRMLALSYTLAADRLLPEEVWQLAYHLGLCDGGGSLGRGLSLEEQAVWLMYSGASVEECHRLRPSDDGDVNKLLSLASKAFSNDCCQEPASYRQSFSSAFDALIESLNEITDGGGCVDRTAAPEGLLGAAREGRVDVVLRLLSGGADVSCEDETGQTALNLAARNGHTDVLSLLLRFGAEADHADCEGWTSLRSAAWGGHTEAVSLLLAAKAEVDYADNDQRTALRAAAWGGHGEIVSMLLSSGADVNRVDKEGRTALTAASYMGHSDIVALLLDRGAKINHCDNDGRTALSVAALRVPALWSHTSVVQLLLERGAAVDHRDKDGATALLVAASEGQRQLCEVLLDGGADIDTADSMGRTPLLAAASAGHVEVVEYLLRRRAATDQIDIEGRTALSVAAQHGSAPIVRMLLDLGMDEMHRDNRGLTALHLAAFEGHKPVVDMLVDIGARLDEVDNEGSTALLLAAQEGRLSIVQMLVDRDSDVDRCSHNGRTPLRAAALRGHTEVVEELISGGADVNYKDADGRSTLYVLALDGRVNMAALLLGHGASVQVADEEGRTALHVACWQGHKEMVALLIANGADVNAVDCEHRTPLQSACWQGHADIANELCQNGARVNHTCNQGATALCVAAQEGHGDVVKILCNYAADPTYVDKFGRTAAKVATKGGHLEVCRILQDYAHQRLHAGQPGPGNLSAARAPTAGASAARAVAHSGVTDDRARPLRGRTHSDTTASSATSHGSGLSMERFAAEDATTTAKACAGNSKDRAAAGATESPNAALPQRTSDSDAGSLRPENQSFVQQLWQLRRQNMEPRLHMVASEGAIREGAAIDFAFRRQTSLRSPVHMANPKIAQNAVFKARPPEPLAAAERWQFADQDTLEWEDTRPQRSGGSRKPPLSCLEAAALAQSSAAMSPRMGRRRNGIRTNPNVCAARQPQNNGCDSSSGASSGSASGAAVPLADLVRASSGLAAPSGGLTTEAAAAQAAGLTALLPVSAVLQCGSATAPAATVVQPSSRSREVTVALVSRHDGAVGGFDGAVVPEVNGMASGSIFVRSTKTAKIINPQKETSPKAVGIVRPTASSLSTRSKETLL